MIIGTSMSSAMAMAMVAMVMAARIMVVVMADMVVVMAMVAKTHREFARTMVAAPTILAKYAARWVILR
jgi:hypothetical protein